MVPEIDLEKLAEKCGEWLRGSGPESDIVISSRIRLAPWLHCRQIWQTGRFGCLSFCCRRPVRLMMDFFWVWVVRPGPVPFSWVQLFEKCLDSLGICFLKGMLAATVHLPGWILGKSSRKKKTELPIEFAWCFVPWLSGR